MLERDTRSRARSHDADRWDGLARGTEPDQGVDADTLLSVLGDEYVRSVLSTLGEDSLAAREIADRSSMSRTTVYRRLDRLEAAGVVEASMSLDPDGQHRKEFRVVLDAVEVPVVGAGGVASSAASDGQGASD
jgi:DNA-binding transcriptional ArsR family regulator